MTVLVPEVPADHRGSVLQAAWETWEHADVDA